MEDRANRDERNPLPFWLLARGVSFFSFFLSFFLFYHCLPYWPWACEVNRAVKASRGRFNIISLTERSDLFCMWSMKKCETVCPRCRLTVTAHTYIYPLCPLPAGCLVSGRNAFFHLPKGIAFLVPDGLVFLFCSLSLSILFFFITCSFWFKVNHQAYTIESFFFLLLPVALCHPTHSCLSPFCTLLHQNCASRQKGHQCFHR